MRVFLAVAKSSFPTLSEISRNVVHLPISNDEQVTVPPGASERAFHASVEALHKTSTWPSQNASTEACKWIAPRLRFFQGRPLCAAHSHRTSAGLIEEAATSALVN